MAMLAKIPDLVRMIHQALGNASAQTALQGQLDNSKKMGLYWHPMGSMNVRLLFIVLAPEGTDGENGVFCFAAVVETSRNQDSCFTFREEPCLIRSEDQLNQEVQRLIQG
jgi:hypothetical protein